jgi:amino acid transporter
MSLALMSVPYGALVVTQVPFVYPKTSLLLVGAISAILTISVVLLWGFLAQAMPRTGGDYIFVSRIVHPVYGFAASFSIVLWTLVVEAQLAAFVAPFGFGSALAAMGAATHNQSLIDSAATVSGKNWQFGVGAIGLIVVVVLLSFNVKAWVRVYAPLFFISVIGVLVAIGLMAVHSRADFQADVARFGTSYQQVIDSAKEAGYGASNEITLKQTIPAVAIGLSFFIFIAFGPYAGSEIRTPKRTLLKAMLIALGIAAVVGLALMGFAARTFGQQFLGSATYLSNFAPDKYPFPAPSLVFFYASILTRNKFLILLINGTFALATLLTILPAVVIATRAIFAWSFDRILPDKLSQVNDRTHSPIVVNVVVLTLMLLFLSLIVYGSSRFLTIAFTAILGQVWTFLAVALAAILFPWRRRELYDASPVSRHRVIGLPAITIVGLLAMLTYLIAGVPLLTNDTLGANSPEGLVTIVLFAVIGVPIFAVSYFVNRRRGVDLRLAFRDLPPE